MKLSWRCRLNGQTRRKTYGPGETRTHDREHILYHWAAGSYLTSKLICHIVELEVVVPSYTTANYELSNSSRYC